MKIHPVRRLYYMIGPISILLFFVAMALCIISALTACTSTHTAPSPTHNPLYQSPPPITRPSPSTQLVPRPSRSPSHKPAKATPSYAHRAIHAGEGCHGFDKGTYAYDLQGNLLYCGPVNADLPTWEPAS